MTDRTFDTKEEQCLGLAGIAANIETFWGPLASDFLAGSRGEMEKAAKGDADTLRLIASKLKE